MVIKVGQYVKIGTVEDGRFESLSCGCPEKQIEASTFWATTGITSSISFRYSFLILEEKKVRRTPPNTHKQYPRGSYRGGCHVEEPPSTFLGFIGIIVAVIAISKFKLLVPK